MALHEYDLGDILAQSPTSVVRRAMRKADGARVIIKIHAKEFPTAREIGQVEFEHRLLGNLRHPTVIRDVELFAEGERLVLVLEDFGGSDLSEQAGRLPLDLFFAIALGIARGLQWVHSQGVVHKDVTPRNVVFNEATGEIKLIDFGIATELSQERQAVDDGPFEGTLPYVSPEQTGRMNRDLDYRSDYYTLGATLFELLTGSLPFSADDTIGWVHCHISRPAPNPCDVNPSVPPALGDIVLKLLAKDPTDRYQSSHGLIADLETCRRAWVGRGAAPSFALGTADVPERFQVSQQLFGREAEAKVLHDAFAEVCTGPARVLLIAGNSGVGKSAIVRELQRDVVRGRGYFIGGKFDQLDRNLPYAAVLQALRGLIKQLLGEPEKALLDWRGKFRSALGANGSVLVDLVPELEEVTGPQQPVPALAPRETHIRLHRAFGDLLRALATAHHPLVLSIDDLQWADPATLELLDHLVCDEALQHLLVVGSYRDNEVQAGHALRLTLNRIQERRPDVLREILLSPLTEDDVNLLVADTLHRDPDSSRAVSAVIAQKTGGNPFFVKELLSMLARDGAFHFVPELGRWDWDEERIAQAAVSDNVVDLMVQRLRRLPPETTEVLSLAACIGNDFDLVSVSRIAGKAAGNVAASLWEAVRERVLVPIGSDYRLVHDGRAYDEAGLNALGVRYQFQHDRVQQAAYLLLEETERPRVHLAIGRLLRVTSSETASDERIFETVKHLNLGRSLVIEANERRALSHLNERAGLRAKRASAYAGAASYFETAAALIEPEEQAAEAGRIFGCARNRAECVFHSGDPERAEALCRELVEAAPDRWTTIEALELLAAILDHSARQLEAVAVLRRGLKLVGVEIPEDLQAVDALIGAGIGKMQAYLARVPVEELAKLPEMTDRGKIATNRLLFHLVIPAIQACPPVFVLAELMMFDLAVTAGTTDVSCKNFVDCGIIQGGILGDQDRAYRLGKVAFELLKRENSRPLAAAVTFVFAAFVSHWRAHYRESLQAFADAVRLGLELGDNAHVSYALAFGAQRVFFVGRPIPECEEKAAGAMAQLTRLRAANHLGGVRLVEHAMARLRGADVEESSEELTARLQRIGNAQWLFLHGHAQCLVSWVLGDYEAAARWDAMAMQYEAGGRIHLSWPDHHALATLLLARKRTGATAEEAEAIDAKIDENLARLRTWAASCPGNYGAKHKIAEVAASVARGAPLEHVIAGYDEAIASAGDDFLPWRALATELHAEQWIARGQPRIARLYLSQAARLYERWGAGAKVVQLRRLHPEAFDPATAEGHAMAHAVRDFTTQHRTAGPDAGSLDLQSMIKATQAISSEVKRERLLGRLMATIMENAGAQRGCLVSRDEASGELSVEVWSSLEGGAEAPRQPVPLAESDLLSPDVVRYVARTRATVVVDDALRDEVHREDPHVKRHCVKSMLCMPVLHQNQLIAVLYAENNAATHAFTPQRLRLLQVIASQAAISITNARLYDGLEERVEARTREIARKNREIAAMLDSMKQGLFTIDDSLAVQPQYSRHLEAIVGTQDIVGQDFMTLVFRDSNVDADAERMMRSALMFSFGVEPFIAEINAEHLVRQFQRRGPDGERRHFEADWTFIADDQGAVCKVLVAVRDVTVMKTLSESVAQKARELDLVGQILDAGIEPFQRLASGARTLLGENRGVLQRRGELARADAELLFRNMHTVKGNARMLGLSHLVEAAHEAEQVHQSAREEQAALDRAELAQALGRVAVVLDEYDDVYRHKLGQLGTADSRASAALSEIGAVIRTAGSGALSAAEALRRVGRASSMATAARLRDIVRETGRMLPSLARELGKVPPDVDCADHDVRLKTEWVDVARDILVHAFRNAMDHGIELPAEREAKGKPSSGRIAVRYRSRDGGGEVVVSDDGRGLSLATLRAKLGDLGSDDEELADKIFLSGVSTAAQVSTTSGRGVGMDAIRAFARRLGGDARVLLTGGEQQGFRPFELVIELPDAAFEGRDTSPSIAAPSHAPPRAQA